MHPTARSGRHFRTPFSSVDAGSDSQYYGGSGLIPNARELLQLMRKTCGRMRGDLIFKLHPAQEWSAAPCCIEPATNGLWGEVTGRGAVSIADNIIADLRGCHVYVSIDDDSTNLQVTTPRGDFVLLRPRNLATLPNWFAALLCWRTSRVGLTAMRDLSLAKGTSLGTFLDTSSAVNLGLETKREPAVIKIDRAILIDNMVDSRESNFSKESVSCVLRDNGELTIQATRGNTSVITVSLDQFPRAAIQKVNDGLLGVNRVTAIYPQCAKSPQATSRLRPIYLSYEHAELSEVWFVLLRAFANSPLMHNPRRGPSSNSAETKLERTLAKPLQFLRVEQTLEIRIDALSLHETSNKVSPSQSEFKASKPGRWQSGIQSFLYVELLLDEQLRARTTMKTKANASLNWHEKCIFKDLGADVPSITIRVKEQEVRTSTPQHNKTSAKNFEDSFSRLLLSEPSGSDTTVGILSLTASGKRAFEDSERPWPLIDGNGRAIGEVNVTIRHKLEKILGLSEYSTIYDLLKDVDSKLSLEIYSKMQSNLASVAEMFLDIFEASSQAAPWLQTLVDREIFGKDKRNNPVGDSTESKTGGLGEEEPSAFLLFRGNTLLSRALDAYMKIKGTEYLERTIGKKVRDIQDADLDCEIDPNRLDPRSDIQRNLHRLKSTTEELWNFIYQSASFCPPELRKIFRYIRMRAEVRYGPTNSTKYTSVSGFLFLRFFCASVLNPQLFGLIQSAPGPRAQRTFVLLAKALQGLANMTSYGYKEDWMTPMNDFCTSHAQQFKEFIDVICIASSSGENDRGSLDAMNLTSYSIATLESVYDGLPTFAREGLPSLPFLNDPARSLARLVELYLDDVENNDSNVHSSDEFTIHGALSVFHQECLRLRAQTQKLDEELGPMPRGSDSLSPTWVALAERLETHPSEFWSASSSTRSGSSPDASATSSTTTDTSKSAKSNKKPATTAQGATVSTNPPNQVRLKPERKDSQAARSTASSGESAKREKKKKKGSPPREPGENALRKLGWL